MTTKIVPKPYGMTPCALLPELTHNELKAYVAIASFQGTNPNAWPSQEDICARLHQVPLEDVEKRHKNALSTAVKGLIGKGWVTRQRRFGKSSIYVCLMAGDEIPSESGKRVIPSQLGHEIPGELGQVIPSESGNNTRTSKRTIDKTNITAEAVSPHKALMDYFHKAHTDHYGEAPIINGKDGAALKRLLAKRTPEEVREKAEALAHAVKTKGATSDFWDCGILPSSLSARWNQLSKVADPMTERQKRNEAHKKRMAEL